MSRCCLISIDTRPPAMPTSMILPGQSQLWTLMLLSADANQTVLMALLSVFDILTPLIAGKVRCFSIQPSYGGYRLMQNKSYPSAMGFVIHLNILLHNCGREVGSCFSIQ